MGAQQRGNVAKVHITFEVKIAGRLPPALCGCANLDESRRAAHVGGVVPIQVSVANWFFALFRDAFAVVPAPGWRAEPLGRGLRGSVTDGVGLRSQTAESRARATAIRI
jgi:hypothetical protein